MLVAMAHPLEGIPASFVRGERWFSFYTHIHAEKRAQQSIEELGFKVFIPFEKRILRRPRAKPRTYEAPLFPRYGFVRFDINRAEWGEIKYCKGVVDILRNDGIPCSVPQQVIDGLSLAESMGLLDRTKPPKVGQDVLVTYGPFHEFIGK